MKEEGAIASGSSRVSNFIMGENKNEISVKGNKRLIIGTYS